MSLFKITVTRENLGIFSRLAKWIEMVLRKEVASQSTRLTNFVIRTYLSGPKGPHSLAQRTGQLRKGTHPLPVLSSGGMVTGGTVIGEKTPHYTPVWVGPKGKKTVIRPKKGRALAIPLPDALNSKGVLKGQFSRGSLYNVPGLFRIKNILYLRKNKGPNGLIPMFVLKDQVQVETRVWPEEIAAMQEPFIQNEIRRAVEQELKQRLR